MKTPIAPEAAVEDLAQLWPHLYAALEHATQETRAFFDQRDAIVNRALAPELVRYFACQSLDDTDQALEYEREVIAKNGISLRLPGYHLRVRKWAGRKLPMPGPSKTLTTFWRQLSLFDTGVPDPDAHHLLVLWEVTAAYKLVGLTLAYPIGAVDDGDDAVFDALWTIDIPHPALTITGEAEGDDDDGDVVVTPKETPGAGGAQAG
jgi:hypothetical protein